MYVEEDIVVVIIGEFGVGKIILLKFLLGIYLLEYGEIILCGNNIN